MLRCECSQQPRLFTCVLAVIVSCPTEIAHGCNLHNCWQIPIKINLVLLSFIINLSIIIHSLIFSIQHSTALIAAVCDSSLCGLKLRYNCVSFKTHNLTDCNPRHSRRVSFLLQNRGCQNEKKKANTRPLSPQKNSSFCHTLKSCPFPNISCSLEPFPLHSKTVLCLRGRF